MSQEPRQGRPAADGGMTLLRALWRHRLVVIGLTSTLTLAGFGLSQLQTPMYEGTARLLLSDPRNIGVFREQSRVMVDPMRYVRNQASVVLSAPVLARAVALAETDVTLHTIRARVAVSPAIDQDLLTIKALAPSPAEAADLANAIAESYQEMVVGAVQRNADRSVTELTDAERDVQAQVDAASAALQQDADDPSLLAERDAAIAQLVDLQTRKKQVTVDASLHGAGVSMFEPAEMPTAPASPNPVRTGLLTGMFGGLLGLGYAWWRSEHSRTAESRQDPAPILRAPLLGEVPDFAAVGTKGSLPSLSAPHSAAAEAYNFIASSVEAALRSLSSSRSNVLLIASACASDGKTTTAANLAVAAARGDRNVLLMDGDIRASGLSKLLNLTATEGLTEVGRGRPIEACLRPMDGTAGRLGVLGAGGQLDDPASFFRSTGFRSAMTNLPAATTMLLVDSPPLLAVTDASAIASLADGIVLVVSRGTPLRTLEDARERLDLIGTPILGYVFNRSQVRHGGYGYGYGDRKVEDVGLSADAPTKAASATPTAPDDAASEEVLIEIPSAAVLTASVEEAPPVPAIRRIARRTRRTRAVHGAHGISGRPLAEVRS